MVCPQVRGQRVGGGAQMGRGVVIRIVRLAAKIIQIG
jgi:hypothetical protein